MSNRSYYSKRKRYHIKIRPSGNLNAQKKLNVFLVVATVISSLALLFLVGGSIISLVVFAYFSKDLPSPSRLTQRDMTLSTKIYDRYGTILYDVYGEENRTLVSLDQVPQELIQATLAAEDAEFYTHQGFDFMGNIRGVVNIMRGGGLQSGSTITQQLVKNVFLSTEQTIKRKIKELILTLQIEKRYSKDEILQMYLNEAPYGGQSWGVESASWMYFQKNSSQLTLSECALLAGLTQSPTAYFPINHPEASLARRNYVLYLMETRGWLDSNGDRHFVSADAAQAVKEEEIKLAPIRQSIKAPHFVMYVKDLLVERYGEELVERGGLQVTTSLDLPKHQKAQELVEQKVTEAQEAGFGLSNGALLALDPKTGQILSMVGSRDYFESEKTDGNVNVTTSLRQPGSSIKPLTYAAAFKQGYTPATLLMDAQTEFDGGVGQPLYVPKNYDGKFRGPVLLRRALANSINVPAVKTLSLVGIDNLLQTARDFGITSLNDPSRYGLSLTLGGGEVSLLEMVDAYGVFASGGVYRQPTAILEVKSGSGKVLERYYPRAGSRVLTEGQAYLISNILSDNQARVEEFGWNTPLRLPDRSAAAKTGTTDDIKDNWTIGYTPSLVIGVWVGNNDNSEMNRKLVSGITGAAPIWNSAIRMWLEEQSPEEFKRPEDIIEITIDALSGELPQSGNTRLEIFVKGTEPQTYESQVYKTLKICRLDGKIANQACADTGEYEEKQFIVFKAERPEWQKYVDEWVSKNFPGDEKYHPPDQVSHLYES
ncbi:penicillin-binding protein [candidate division WWE3 bacterium CG08_land_8_20_14_0_20_43_13]|uniref:Penicillin-binding protein n=1 Tax=candidate division WWE3 bacterium CG08_land_8_20_14_0_20_43_13 TaxID=1975087 RepID=A0A2H0X847_UNCKA|nr:MAG: penicillin-binding protein [candidate division WWE3 bacterium CG08_land_8_20_14_0_20_43_13]